LLACSLAGCEVLFPLDDSCGSRSIGHDEDGDGIDDACDNCPGIVNADQLDMLELMNGEADADGIGDVCDPNPTMPGDSIVRFDAFADDQVGARWTFDALWTFDGDSLTFLGGGFGHVDENLDHPAPPFTIEYTVQLDGAYGVLNDHVFVNLGGLLFDRRGVTCGVTFFEDALDPPGPPPEAGTGTHATYVDAMAGARNGDASLLADPVVTDDRIRVVADFTGSNIDCSAIGVGEVGAPTPAGFALEPPRAIEPSDRIGFEGGMVPVKIESMVVYTTGL